MEKRQFQVTISGMMDGTRVEEIKNVNLKIHDAATNQSPKLNRKQVDEIIQKVLSQMMMNRIGGGI